MAKTIQSMLKESEIKKQYWQETACDSQALEDLNKTERQAECLESYYEGRADAFHEALNLKRK